MEPVRAATPTTTDPGHDAITAAALAVVRRALVEGVPVTREGLAEEASIALGRTPEDALLAVDATAQRLGISSLG